MLSQNQLLNKIWDTLDSDATGFVTQKEFQCGPLSSLAENFSEDSRVSRKEFNDFFNTLLKEKYDGDESDFVVYLTNLCEESGVSVSSTESKDVTTETERRTSLTLGTLRTILGSVYIEAKKKVPLPSQLADQVQKIETLVDSKSEQLVNIVDGKITQIQDVAEAKKSELLTKAEELKTSVTKRIVSLQEEPIVKSVVSRVLSTSDAVVDYALPAGSDEEDEDDDSVKSPTEHVKHLAETVTKRLVKRKERFKTDLLSYHAAFLGKQQSTQKQLSAFAEKVVATSRQRFQGEWDKVNPVFLAVTSYGEYFMESVREYENDGVTKKVTPPAGAVNLFISKLAHEIIEPAMVRTIAVFYVCGDEVRRIRTEQVGPRVIDAKKKFEVVSEDVKKAVSAKLVQKAVELAKLREKLQQKLREFDFKNMSEVVKTKFFTAVGSLELKKVDAYVRGQIADLNIEDTVQGLRLKFSSALKKYELEKYEKQVSDVVKKIHDTIVEWVSTVKKTKNTEDVKSE